MSRRTLKWGTWKKLMWENEEMRGGAIWETGDKGENQEGASFFALQANACIS